MELQQTKFYLFLAFSILFFSFCSSKQIKNKEGLSVKKTNKTKQSNSKSAKQENEKTTKEKDSKSVINQYSYLPKEDTVVPKIEPNTPLVQNEFQGSPLLPKRKYLPLSAERTFFLKYLPKLKGKKIWLISNGSGIARKNLRLQKLFLKHKVKFLGYLAMEHGIFGVEENFKKIKKGKLPKVLERTQRRFSLPQIKIYNLYKLKTKELKRIMAKADIILFDVGEVGIRCYTYLTILKRLIDILHKYPLSFKHKKLLLIDHINPVASLATDGIFIRKGYKSFVGEMPIPLYHGLTIGELANYYRRKFAKKAKLTIIKLNSYKRETPAKEYRFWRPTSPNLPGIESVINYQALVFLEGINVSIGRGTSGPFLYFGAPFIHPEFLIRDPRLRKLNVKFTEVYFTPNASVYKGKFCSGLKMHALPGFNPLKTIYTIISVLFDKYPHKIKWNGKGKIRHFDRLWGSNSFRKAIVKKISFQKFWKSIKKDRNYWNKQKKFWYLY